MFHSPAVWLLEIALSSLLVLSKVETKAFSVPADHLSNLKLKPKQSCRLVIHVLPHNL